MNMTREDILRELELLPVWKANPAQTLALLQQVTEPAAAVVQSVVDEAPAVLDVETTTLEITALVTIEQTIQAAPEAEALLEKVAPEKTAVEKIVVAWLLYCPLVDTNVDAPANADVLTLLKNMINAMQLLSTDYQLVHDVDAVARYQAQQTLLFGLPAANTFLGTQASNLDSLGHQPIAHAQSHCWVIDHPADLLQTPMRKRQAWQTMCEAKAFAKQGST